MAKKLESKGQGYLELREVTTHNLKGFDLKIPLHQLVVITGPSGSGKSSLAFDTIAKLAKKKMDLLKNYANPLIEDIKVQARLMSPLPPVIALAQGVRNWYPYKTVGEILGLLSFLEAFFSEEGEFCCPQCGVHNQVHSLSQFMKWLEEVPQGEKFYFLLPLRERSLKALSYFLSQGFTRYIIEGKEIDLSEESLQGEVSGNIYLVLDRVIKEEKVLSRLLENIRLAKALNRGQVIIRFLSGAEKFFNFSKNCQHCGNSLYTYFKKCSSCKGQGYKEREPCESCGGLKLENFILESKLWERSIREILHLSLRDFFGLLKHKGLSKDLQEKAEWLGIGHLRLCKPVFQLSLGERKLLEIFLLFSSDLQGVLYVLDEPTLGLDKEGRKRLLELLREILAKGNSLLVVEHDLDFLWEADFVIELGPGAGERGGYLLRACSKEEYRKDPLKAPTFAKKDPKSEKWVEFKIGNREAKILKDAINLLQLGSNYEEYAFLREMALALENRGFKVLLPEEVYTTKKERFLVDYLGLWEAWREVLCELPSAKAKGLSKAHFSFHTKEGVCPECKGKGYKKLPWEELTSYALCESCLGKGLNYEVLNLNYRGYKLSEILDFSLEEALNLFSQIPKMREILLWAKDLKVDYLKLSQRLGELSGGEILRINLIRKLIGKEKFQICLLYYPFQGLSVKDLTELHHFLRKLNQISWTIIMRETHPLAEEFADYTLLF